MLFKIGVLKRYAIFTGKHLCCSLFLIRSQTFRQKRCFSVNIVKYLKTALFIEHLHWLLLHFTTSLEIITEKTF